MKNTPFAAPGLQPAGIVLPFTRGRHFRHKLSVAKIRVC